MKSVFTRTLLTACIGLALSAGAPAQDHPPRSRAVQAFRSDLARGGHVRRAVEPSLFFAGHVGTR